MTSDLSTDETIVVAVYSTRRDAEVALDYLEDEGIQGFISADDAGGMHPQLQRPHGVKLLVLGHAAAEQAHTMLEDVNLLPANDESAGPDMESTDEAGRRRFFTRTVALVVVFIFVIGLLAVGVLSLLSS